MNKEVQRQQVLEELLTISRELLEKWYDEAYHIIQECSSTTRQDEIELNAEFKAIANKINDCEKILKK